MPFTVNNLKSIWKKRRLLSTTSAGIDGVDFKRFTSNLDAKLKKISNKLNNGTYKFQPLYPHFIRKEDNKYRVICIPTIEDRLVQKLILDSLTEKDTLGILNHISFTTKGTHAAVKQALKLRNTYPWALKTDISAFFDKID